MNTTQGDESHSVDEIQRLITDFASVSAADCKNTDFVNDGERLEQEYEATTEARKRYKSRLSKANDLRSRLSQFSKSPHLDLGHIQQDVKLLDGIKKDHSRLRENLSSLNTQLQDTKTAQTQIEAVLSKMEALDARLTDRIGLDGWS